MVSESIKGTFIKLPSDTELVLYLIKEELKNNKLFNGLRMAGLEDCFYQSDLSPLVLGYAGFDENSDDLVEYYHKLLDRYTEKIEPDNRVIMQCAFDLYTDLMIEKRKKKLCE